MSHNAYIWNLEKCYQWTYFQGRNRDTDLETPRGEAGVGGTGRLTLTGRHY